MLPILSLFLVSLMVTQFVRLLALRWGLLDVPNHRSAHSQATPRGGGIGFVMVFLFTTAWLARQGTISGRVGGALIGGGLAVAVVGFLDDRFQLPAQVRVVVHFAAAGWAVWRLGGVAPLQLGWVVWDWGWIGYAVAIVGLVWMINLYNFMDGIDGLAGLEALAVSGFGSLILAWSAAHDLSIIASVLAATVAGFLVWNWPPAKIFMGDAGSGFLGYVLGLLAIASARDRPWMLWVWVILLGVFIVDATVTLLRRAIARARWYEAHSAHAYQHAARRWGSHLRVTLTVAVFNIGGLLPLAWAGCLWPTLAPLLAMVALTALTWVAVHHGAGLEMSPAALSARSTSED